MITFVVDLIHDHVPQKLFRNIVQSNDIIQNKQKIKFSFRPLS